MGLVHLYAGKCTYFEFCQSSHLIQLSEPAYHVNMSKVYQTGHAVVSSTTKMMCTFTVILNAFVRVCASKKYNFNSSEVEVESLYLHIFTSTWSSLC